MMAPRVADLSLQQLHHGRELSHSRASPKLEGVELAAWNGRSAFFSGTQAQLLRHQVQDQRGLDPALCHGAEEAPIVSRN